MLSLLHALSVQTHTIVLPTVFKRHTALTKKPSGGCHLVAAIGTLNAARTRRCIPHLAMSLHAGYVCPSGVLYVKWALIWCTMLEAAWIDSYILGSTVSIYATQLSL